MTEDCAGDEAPDLDLLLAQLRQSASRVLGYAVTAPPPAYWRQAVARLEQTRNFRKSWLFSGFAADIPRLGDYLTNRIAVQPVVAARHAGRGNMQHIVCPYHAWTYGYDGRLAGAGHMQRTDCFDRARHGLPEIRTEIWKGWIYLTLNPEARPVAEMLQPLADLVDRYGIEDCVPGLSLTDATAPGATRTAC